MRCTHCSPAIKTLIRSRYVSLLSRQKLFNRSLMLQGRDHICSGVSSITIWIVLIHSMVFIVLLTAEHMTFHAVARRLLPYSHLGEKSVPRPIKTYDDRAENPRLNINSCVKLENHKSILPEFLSSFVRHLDASADGRRVKSSNATNLRPVSTSTKRTLFHTSCACACTKTE